MKLFLVMCVLATGGISADAATRIRIMPPDRGVLAVGQRVDIRVEATTDSAARPEALTVLVNGRDVTVRNDPASDRGAPANTRNFLLRGFSADSPGPLRIHARTPDGATAEVGLSVEAWRGRASTPAAKNIILLLGDGMGAAHRTAARIASRGIRDGKAIGRLAMDTLDVTGMVMTASLNAIITDSSPGMAAYSTGQKNNNNQEGVFPDNTRDAFDNPRIEYIGELLRRTRGPGFNVGIVTTADVTDSTPAANAAHTSDRYAGAAIAAQFFDERSRNGIAVLLGGGSRHFMPKNAGGERPDNRRLAEEYERAGYTRVSSARDVAALLEKTPPRHVLGLFHASHMAVAFDKVGAGSYSNELAQPKNAPYRDTPMLEDLARLAVRSLAAHSPAGFYLMIEGASIDKRAHAADAERTIWDVIEFDRAVQIALDFARTTNTDRDPTNDTLVIVTADHETGAMGLIGVGNERYAPRVLGKAVRDYAAVFRFDADQQLGFVPNYTPDDRGFPVDPDPTKKLLLGWGSTPDRLENWLSDPLQHEAAVVEKGVAIANTARDAGEPVAGRFIEGTIENGATPCPAECPADTASDGHTVTGHTASDVPLSASGPGAWQFTGVYENTDVFLKMLRSAAGTYGRPRP
jgi:alkaline phosphatase